MNRLESIVLGLCAMMLPTIGAAQILVLGQELGVSTEQQVMAAVPREANVQGKGENKFTGGLQFETSGDGYGVEALSKVSYIFDEDKKLASVILVLGKHRFDDLFGVLAKKYTVTAKERPNLGDMSARLNGKGGTVILNAPHLSFELTVSYVRDDLYRNVVATTEKEKKEQRDGELRKL